MIRIFNAKAVARTLGIVTFASAVFDGPVLKNRKNTAMKRQTQAAGNRTQSMAIVAGKASKTPTPETRKYELAKRLRNPSPAQPPRSVAKNPALARIAPNVRLM